MTGLLNMGFLTIYPVNPRDREILSLRSYPSVKDILTFPTSRVNIDINRLRAAVANAVDNLPLLNLDVAVKGSALEFPPKESQLCECCEYPDLCPRRKHFFKVEALPVNEYLSEPGVVLV